MRLPQKEIETISSQSWFQCRGTSASLGKRAAPPLAKPTAGRSAGETDWILFVCRHRTVRETQQLTIARALQKEQKLECRQSFINVVTNLQLGVGAKRVAAAKARRKFDKAASALGKVERQVSDGETNDSDKSSGSGDDWSSGESSGDTGSWFSEDELETDEG